MNNERGNPGPSPEELLFSGALEISAGLEREAWLYQACAGDQPLRARVTDLLAAHEAMRRPGRPPDDQFGPYMLVEKLGQGAFGTVWRAWQEQPLRREVALKILHPGMDNDQVFRRFEAERQVLALLAHENIAKIYNAGVSAQGRPYFVMELVKGPKITEYCDQRRLDTAARLQLFSQVCRAIQYAHDQGIIHRDLKPSNILVSEHRGVASPKIIDFGIAKALHQRLTERTLHTVQGQVMGTFSYMSPEQTAVQGTAVDARSDIYSLGALLYELLVGHPPVTEAEFNQMFFDEVIRTIRKKHPPRPSDRLAAMPEPERSEVAGRRDTRAEKLPEIVGRDLDWLVLRCLEKDRRHRYQNAGELVARIEQHLQQQPLPEAGLRFRYWARRNAVAGMRALQLIITAAILWLVWLYCQPAPPLRAAAGPKTIVWHEMPVKVAGYDRPWRREWICMRMSGQEGWLAGGQDYQAIPGQPIGYGILLHTANGGHLWQNISLTNSDAGKGVLSHFEAKTWDGIGPVTGLDDQFVIQAPGQCVTNVWIATQSGIFSSTNPLATNVWWHRMTPDPGLRGGYSEFAGLVVVEPQREVYAYGWQGISHWEMGGRWELQLATYLYNIQDFCVVDKYIPDAWAVGNGGSAARSLGGAYDYGSIYHLHGPGGHWQRVTLPFQLAPQQDLKAIMKIPLSNEFLVVGAGGLILRSSHNGADWHACNPVKAALGSLARQEPATFWAAGDYGTILKSGDDGATWETWSPVDDHGRRIQDNLKGLTIKGRHAWVIGDQRLWEFDLP